MVDTSAKPPTKKARLDGIDTLRGLVMVIMAIDHSRDFFSNSHAYFDPIDVTSTSVGFFFTRWITDFCAPVFSFLAGIGIYLSMSRGVVTIKETAVTLVTRGFWLILLELTIVRIFWYFNFDFTFLKAGVLWCLGWSMIFLAGLIFLPRRVVLAISLLIILPHNLLDSINPEFFGSISWLWILLHDNSSFVIGNSITFKVVYPLIPWLGVMAAGYCFGEIIKKEPAQRRRIVFLTGLALTFCFVIIRGLNLYGDPAPWTAQDSRLFSFLSFLACEKYPPSVSYLLMTLGPPLILLSLLDRPLPSWINPMITFGRVPFLFYLLHLPLLHAFAVAVSLLRFGKADWLFQNPPLHNWPYDFQFDLLFTYAGWLAVILLLYPLCRLFADYKSKHRSRLLSYL